MENGRSAIRITDRQSSPPVLARRATVTPSTGCSGASRVRLGFTRMGLRLLPEPFSQDFREQCEYAVLGLLAIPADGAAGYGRHSDVRTG